MIVANTSTPPPTATEILVSGLTNIKTTITTLQKQNSLNKDKEVI